MGLVVTTTNPDGPAESHRRYQLRCYHVPGDSPFVLFNSSTPTFPAVLNDCTKIGLVAPDP
jgi:hypothetical protein